MNRDQNEPAARHEGTFNIVTNEISFNWKLLLKIWVLINCRIPCKRLSIPLLLRVPSCRATKTPLFSGELCVSVCQSSRRISLGICSASLVIFATFWWGQIYLSKLCDFCKAWEIKLMEFCSLWSLLIWKSFQEAFTKQNILWRWGCLMAACF